MEFKFAEKEKVEIFGAKDHAERQVSSFKEFHVSLFSTWSSLDLDTSDQKSFSIT